MRLETTTTNPVNPHMQLSIWCNNNFKHLNVIIMMRMTCASFMQYLWKHWHDKIWGICHRGGNERGATTTNGKWCHGNISVPVAHRDTGVKKVWIYGACKRWWGDPGYRVPTGRWHGKVHKQSYKLSGAQYATSCILTEHHINYLVLSRLCTQHY